MENPFEELKQELSEIKKLIKEKQPEELLTYEQVADLLQVDRQTVIKFKNQGLLTAHGLGKKMVRFKRSEVLGALEQINGRAA